MTTLVIVLACGVTAVLADTDPIAERRALMKHDGEAAKKLFDMSKGKIPFDLATVKESLATLNEGATKSAALFPDNSKTGGGTAALPAIWQNKADFDEKSKKLEEESAKLVAANDEAAVKAQFGNVGKACGGCHETYRSKEK